MKPAVGASGGWAGQQISGFGVRSARRAVAAGCGARSTARGTEDGGPRVCRSEQPARHPPEAGNPPETQNREKQSRWVNMHANLM